MKILKELTRTEFESKIKKNYRPGVRQQVVMEFVNSGMNFAEIDVSEFNGDAKRIRQEVSSYLTSARKMNISNLRVRQGKDGKSILFERAQRTYARRG